MNNMRNKILSLLVLLLTAASGAWAEQTVVMPGLMAPTDNSTTIDENTWKWVQVWTVANNLYMDFEIKNGSQFTGDFTPTRTQLINGLKAYGLDVCGENGKVSTVQLLSADGKVLKTAEINKALVYDEATRIKVAKEFFAEMTTDNDYIVRVNLGDCNIAWDAATKKATFSMPAFDVEIAPIYAPAAKWDVVETVPQQPAALEGIIAGQDAAIVTAGQSAQGTVMYAVTTSAEPAPALTAFSATVPTAKDYDDAMTLYVWYYIQGHDTPDGQQATEENTFNDSEICAEPIKVEVLSNKFDIALKAANANTIEAGKATVKVGETAAEVKEGKLTGVKMGSKVTITAKEGYKFRKAEGKKTVKE